MGDLCVEFEYAFGMAKDEQPGAANNQGTAEFGANAGVADIPADSMECFPVRNKINAKAGFHAAASIFEFANALDVAHSFEFLAAQTLDECADKTRLPVYRLETLFISTWGRERIFTIRSST
jgi:hypothetical protein